MTVASSVCREAFAPGFRAQGKCFDVERRRACRSGIQTEAALRLTKSRCLPLQGGSRVESRREEHHLNFGLRRWAAHSSEGVGEFCFWAACSWGAGVICFELRVGKVRRVSDQRGCGGWWPLDPRPGSRKEGDSSGSRTMQRKDQSPRVSQVSGGRDGRIAAAVGSGVSSLDF